MSASQHNRRLSLLPRSELLSSQLQGVHPPVSKYTHKLPTSTFQCLVSTLGPSPRGAGLMCLFVPFRAGCFFTHNIATLILNIHNIQIIILKCSVFIKHLIVMGKSKTFIVKCHTHTFVSIYLGCSCSRRKVHMWTVVIFFPNTS